MRRASAHERAELMRNQFYFLGKNVELYTLSFGTEPYLISIHDNVICAHDVDFVNHDVSVFNAAQYLDLRQGDIDKVGSIELFENCFVGARTILLSNSSVGKNSIVAAGSIVKKLIPDNDVWGGVPAKFIMKVEDYFAKIQIQSEKYPWMPLDKKTGMTKDELVRSRQKFFFKKIADYDL